jgi:hypothetical protein
MTGQKVPHAVGNDEDFGIRVSLMNGIDHVRKGWG